MKTVNVNQANSNEGMLLKHWLKLSVDNHIVHFRYENFMNEEETSEVYDVLVNCREDTYENQERWDGMLDIVRTHLKEIVDGALEEIKNPSEESFDRTYMVIR